MWVVRRWGVGGLGVLSVDIVGFEGVCGVYCMWRLCVFVKKRSVCGVYGIVVVIVGGMSSCGIGIGIGGGCCGYGDNVVEFFVGGGGWGGNIVVVFVGMFVLGYVFGIVFVSVVCESIRVDVFFFELFYF